MNPIHVDVRKWPDTPHWHCQVFPLGEDAHGRWFCLPAGSVIQRRPLPARTHPGSSVLVVAEGRWWSAWFHARPHPVSVYVDIVAPARFAAASIEVIDLDLDVIRDWSGETHVIDVDEFEEHRITLDYPPALTDGARSAAEEVHKAIEARLEPFDRVGAEWLRHAEAGAWPVDTAWLDKLA